MFRCWLSLSDDYKRLLSLCPLWEHVTRLRRSLLGSSAATANQPPKRDLDSPQSEGCGNIMSSYS